MKKLLSIILLGSALLLPNHYVEASHAEKEVQVGKVQQVKKLGWIGKSNSLNQFNKKKVRSYYMNWSMPLYKYSTTHKSKFKAPSKKWYSKENANVEKEPNEEQVPDLEEVPEIEETPDHEQESEQPSKPEQAPTPTEPNQKPNTENEPVEESKPNASVSAIEQEVLTLTNAEREKAGLAPLQFDEKLVESARAKSKDMSVNQYFSHTSPTYGSPFDQMQSFGVTYRAAAENIASGQRTPKEVVQAWMNSPGHRQNILTPHFTHIGIGYDQNGNYWTQQFIQK